MSLNAIAKNWLTLVCVLASGGAIVGAPARDGAKPQFKPASTKRQGGLLSSILVPLSEPSEADNATFAKAMRAYQGGTNPKDVAALLAFVEKYPGSPWIGTAYMALGMAYRETQQPEMAAQAFRHAERLFDRVAKVQKGTQGLADWAAVEAAEQEMKKGNAGGFVRVANRMSGREMGLTAASTPVGGRHFEYDVENRVVSITMGSHVTEFEYDGLGFMRVIREKDNGEVSSEKRYLWDPTTNEMLAEQAPDGTMLKQFFPEGMIDSDGTALYYTRDHLGSIRELVDSQGVVRARYEYDPWGRTTKVAGDKDTPFRFTGHLWHEQSGLYLTKYRAYDPNLGRWTTRDPLGEADGPNMYAYVGNNPINAWDELGLKTVCVTKAMWVTAYNLTGRKTADGHRTGPGTVASWRTPDPMTPEPASDLDSGRATRPYYPFGSDVTIWDADGTEIYNGVVHDIGPGTPKSKYVRGLKERGVRPESWIDIWSKNASPKSKHPWKTGWYGVKICWDDGCDK